MTATTTLIHSPLWWQLLGGGATLPPVMGLIAVVAFGTLVGMRGSVAATPLIVVLLVLVRRLYVEEPLEGQPA